MVLRYSRLNIAFPFALALICLALYSCRSGKGDKITPDQVTLVQLLVGDGSNQFRHTSLGLDWKTVMSSEKKAPEEKDTNYLFYSLAMDTLHPDSIREQVDTLNYFTVAYNFDQQKLNEIDEDVFVATDSVAGKVFHRLSDYFTSKYGQPDSHNDATIWTIKRMNSKTARISLSDESEEYDYGKLSVVYYLED